MSGNENPRKFLIFFPKKIIFSNFRKWNPAFFSSSSKNKHLLYFRSRKFPRKFFIFSQKTLPFYFRKQNPPKNLLYFRKRNFLKFQEMELPCHKISEFLIFRRNFQSPKNQNFWYFSKKKVVNKFFKKHFRTIVSTYSINWINEHY